MAVLAGCGACQDAPSTATDPIPDGGAPDVLTYTEHGAGLSRVVQVRWAGAVDPAGRVDPVRVQTMLQGAVARLTGGSNPWATWAGARHIGIKVNSIDAQAFTHPELADAAARAEWGSLSGVRSGAHPWARALCAAGADPAHVTVWDRDSDGLRRRGYTIDRTGAQLGYRCLGSDAAIDEQPEEQPGDNLRRRAVARQLPAGFGVRAEDLGSRRAARDPGPAAAGGAGCAGWWGSATGDRDQPTRRGPFATRGCW